MKAKNNNTVYPDEQKKPKPAKQWKWKKYKK